jgi:uncharacterized membrane protein
VNRFERWAVWISSVTTVVTGVVYLWLKYVLVSDDPFAVVNSPWQGPVLKLHVVAAPTLVFAFGLVALRHVWRHLRNRVAEGRVSGLTGVVALVPMIATGYLILSVTDVGWLSALAWTHIGLGLLYAAAIVFHQVTAGGRRARVQEARRRRIRRHRRRRERRVPGDTRAAPEADR